MPVSRYVGAGHSHTIRWVVQHLEEMPDVLQGDGTTLTNRGGMSAHSKKRNIVWHILTLAASYLGDDLVKKLPTRAQLHNKVVVLCILKHLSQPHSVGMVLQHAHDRYFLEDACTGRQRKFCESRNASSSCEQSVDGSSRLLVLYAWWLRLGSWCRL